MAIVSTTRLVIPVPSPGLVGLTQVEQVLGLEVFQVTIAEGDVPPELVALVELALHWGARRYSNHPICVGGRIACRQERGQIEVPVDPRTLEVHRIAARV